MIKNGFAPRLQTVIFGSLLNIFETKEAAIEAGKKSYLSGTRETLIQKSKTYSVIGSRKT